METEREGEKRGWEGHMERKRRKQERGKERKDSPRAKEEQILNYEEYAHKQVNLVLKKIGAFLFCFSKETSIKVDLKKEKGKKKNGSQDLTQINTFGKESISWLI